MIIQKSDARIILEKIENLQKWIASEFKVNREQHKDMMIEQTVQGKKVARNTALLGVGGTAILLLIGLFARFVMGTQ